MKRIILIGDPIEHSLSPALFQLAYSQNRAIQLGQSDVITIDGSEYQYTILREKSFEKAFAEFIENKEIIACNITAPFKEKVSRFITHPDRKSKEIGAFNLITKREGNRLYGYNTDYYAALHLIKKSIGHKLEDLMAHQRKLAEVNQAETVKSTTAYIIGAGGVAKAAAKAIKDLNLDCIVSNRDHTKGRQLADSIGAKFLSLDNIKDAILCSPSIYKIIIYTLPVDISLFSIEDFQRESMNNCTVIEPNYKEPSMLKLCSQKDNTLFRYFSGIEWLIEQAIYGFEIITNHSVDKNRMLSVADLAKRE